MLFLQLIKNYLRSSLDQEKLSTEVILATRNERSQDEAFENPADALASTSLLLARAPRRLGLALVLTQGRCFVCHAFFFFALIENLVSLTSPQALSQKVDSRG